MGYGFPTGMRLVSALDTGPTPWFWGINGAAGVLAASAAVIVSIAFSIDATLAIGGLAYLLLLPFALALFRAAAGRAAAAPAGSLRSCRARAIRRQLRACWTGLPVARLLDFTASCSAWEGNPCSRRSVAR